MPLSDDQIRSLTTLTAQKKVLEADKAKIEACNDFDTFKCLSQVNYDSVQPCIASIRNTAIGCVEDKISDIDDQIAAIQA